MKKILFFVLFLYSIVACATNNAVKMGYNFVTVSQTVVFDSAMQSGGTLTFTAKAMDGGGRNPGDPFTMKLVFYNSSNQVVNTVQQAWTLVLGGALQTYSLSANNCGSSCSGVAYVSVQFYGKDGGYWAGNYGPYIQDPSLTFNGGGNILYNPEFGVYGTNGYAQGWTSSNGWQSCALYSGAQTCVVNNGAPVNGGNYSSTGGTTSSTPGGQTTTPTLCCGGSSAVFAINATNAAKINTFTSRPTSDGQIYIQQIGNQNSVLVEQTGTKNNYVNYYGNGSSNNVSVNQSAMNNLQTNYLDLVVSGTNNRVDVKQQVVNETNAFTKGAFINIQDNNNIVTLQQKNGGSHYAEINLSGGNKTVDITQQGSAGHMASVTLTGQAASLSLIQSGSTQQFYSINSNCATAGGCAAITVTQGQ